MAANIPWSSKLSLEQVFSQTKNFSHPTPYKNGCVYLSSVKEEDNRNALFYLDTRTNQSHCLVLEPFNLHSKVNEYGGKPFWIFGNAIVFANQDDQKLYQFDLDDRLTDNIRATLPVAVSPRPPFNQIYMYADVVGLQNQWLLAVVESAIKAIKTGDENVHSIQAVSLANNEHELIPLASGASFYSNLVVSKDETRVAWVQWDHPSMPWDETELWVADINVDFSGPKFINQRRIQLSAGASVCQLIFANNGNLFFSVDYSNVDTNSSKNYWNIVSYDFNAYKIRPVSSVLQEFAYPHWQYGDARIVQFDKEYLLSFATSADGDRCYLIHQDTLEYSLLQFSNKQQKTFQNLSSNGAGKANAIMLSANSNPSIIEFTNNINALTKDLKVLFKNPEVMDHSDISIAEHIEFTTTDGSKAFGYYYAPVNENYAYASGEAPPLIVMVHGGPTARAYGYFDLQKQFWTNRGFAIFDVNHRGSSGYGRAFRDALYGQWGITDINDIVDGITVLNESEKADPNKVCIRGKSAGGYAVLRALTEHPNLFRAGACYYGIGNLSTLAQVTHKFEKYYTDRLVGEKYGATTASLENSLFYLRSPINNVSRLKTPMIIFQGLEDKIVPPAVAQEMVSVLKEAGVSYRYVEYPDEGHGFRQSANNIDAWTKELDFYQTILAR